MQVSTKGTFGHFGCGFTVLPTLMSTDVPMSDSAVNCMWDNAIV